MNTIRSSEYERFDKALEKYLPSTGEGETMASQAVTATNKLVYKWYNDGDVYDNTKHLPGWANDLSSYANWLARYYGCADILDAIWDARSDADYEGILWTLAGFAFDEERLAYYEKQPKTGSIYDCAGDYRFEDPDGEFFESWEDYR